MYKKKISKLLGISVLLLALTACASSAPEEDVAADESDSAFEIVQAEKQEKISFEEANIFAFTLENRDDQSYDEIIATFKAVNHGEQAIDYLSVDFAYLDAGGNEICDDGRYNDYQIRPGCAALVRSYSYLDGAEKSDIADVVVKSYEYEIGTISYEVNLQTEEVDVMTFDERANVDFESVNILSFDCEGVGVEYDSYKVAVKIANNGELTVSEVSYDMAYVDDSGTLLEKDSRYCDSAITTGKYVSSKSYCTEDSVVDNIAGFGVYAYEYDLVDVDENGYNCYEVNLQTKVAIGRFIED